MKKKIENLLTESGYKDVGFKECIYDIENYKNVIAYNFIALKESIKTLISVEVEENTLIIWESLEGVYDGDDWLFIKEVNRGGEIWAV